MLRGYVYNPEVLWYGAVTMLCKDECGCYTSHNKEGYYADDEGLGKGKK